MTQIGPLVAMVLTGCSYTRAPKSTVEIHCNTKEDRAETIDQTDETENAQERVKKK